MEGDGEGVRGTQSGNGGQRRLLSAAETRDAPGHKGIGGPPEVT